MGISIWQLLIVLVIVLLLFGTKKLRNMGGDLGAAIRNFKGAVKEGGDEAKESGGDGPYRERRGAGRGCRDDVCEGARERLTHGPPQPSSLPLLRKGEGFRFETPVAVSRASCIQAPRCIGPARATRDPPARHATGPLSMFDVGFQEITLIGLIALIVVGPERLPRMARTLGLWMGKIRYYVGQVKSDIDREVRAQELKEMLDKPARELDELKSVAEETKGTLDQAKGLLGEAKTTFDDAAGRGLDGQRAGRGIDLPDRAAGRRAGAAGIAGDGIHAFRRDGSAAAGIAGDGIRAFRRDGSAAAGIAGDGIRAFRRDGIRRRRNRRRRHPRPPRRRLRRRRNRRRRHQRRPRKRLR